MSPPNTKLADALAALALLQRTGHRVIQSKQLSRTQRERLVKAAFLQEVLKGWYLPARPDVATGASGAWYLGMRDFITGYCNARFGDAWHVGPEQSLMLRTGERTLPQQVLVWTRKGNNQLIPLPEGCSLYLYQARSAKLLPSEPVEDAAGMRLVTIPAALANVGPGFYTQQPLAARLALASLEDTSDLLRVLLEGSHSVIAGRLAGALRALARETQANDILNAMRSAGYTVIESQPFESIPRVLPGDRVESPYVGRLRIMWDEMRDAVADALPRPRGKAIDLAEALAEIEARYVADAYNSLSIEGYHVTSDLIERVRSGTWDPDGVDKPARDAMAAKGYFEAHKLVKSFIATALKKGAAPTSAEIRDALISWHRALFSPSVLAGLLKTSDLAGWRNDQVYIRGARHVPVSKEAVRDCMPALFDLLAQEPHPGVRAVLGHFFFVYIHPYMDGNGRLARFLMNAMLVSGGYVWTIVPLQRRDDYMAALDAASSGHDIVPFARLIAELVREQTKKPLAG
jgi:hypothetical protein